MRYKDSIVSYHSEFGRMSLVMGAYADGFNYSWEYSDGESPCGGWYAGTYEEVQAFALERMRAVRVAAAQLFVTTATGG